MDAVILARVRGTNDINEIFKELKLPLNLDGPFNINKPSDPLVNAKMTPIV